jgi:hypothetical protein
MTGLKALEISNLEWKNDTMLISKIMKTKPLLVFKYANSNCHSCYETYLNELKKIFEDFSSDVAVLCSYQTERDLLIFKQMNKITYPMYRIPTDAFNWKAEDYNNPYYFVLHPDMKISHIYIPDKAFPDMNRAYLESVKRLLTP